MVEIKLIHVIHVDSLKVLLMDSSDDVYPSTRYSDNGLSPVRRQAII